MRSYVILSDSDCDISPDLLREWEVGHIDLTFHEENSDVDFTNAQVPSAEFYRQMREGKVFKTSAANVETFMKAFGEKLGEGYDVLYLGFSSGLSSTVDAARMAAGELKNTYPEQKVIVVDTLCASAGQGLELYLTVQKKKQGASIEECAAYAEEILPHLCHWFVVDELVYLKRGGRINPASAFIGGVLNIKPVLHTDDEGHLINMMKVRGRKQSILKLFQKYEELALDKEHGVYFISHGDCIDDARLLESMIREKFGKSADLITDIGAVIGSHSGPGTLALFFLGEHR